MKVSYHNLGTNLKKLVTVVIHMSYNASLKKNQVKKEGRKCFSSHLLNLFIVRVNLFLSISFSVEDKNIYKT